MSNKRICYVTVTAVLESCTVSFNGRDRPTDQRLVYGKSIRMLGSFLPFSFPGKWKAELQKCKSGKYKSVKRGESVKVYSVREELFILYNLC